MMSNTNAVKVTHLFLRLKYSPGGCALNTCRVFSWLNQADRGAAEATFVGATGNDEPKRRLEDALRKEGLTAK